MSKYYAIDGLKWILPALFLPVFGLFFSSQTLAATTAATIKPWPHSTMPFLIEKEVPLKLRQRILKAVERINQLSIIQLVEIKDENNLPDDGASVFTYKRNICSSGYGWNGDTNNLIKVSDECEYGSLLHEILHALGFLHEQVNPKRNIEFIFDRLKTGNEDQNFYDKAIALTDYDIHSIMHYSSYAESICYSPTDPKWSDPNLKRLPHASCRNKDWEKLTAENNAGVDCHKECAVFYDPFLGPVESQREDLSELDIQGLKALYPKENLNHSEETGSEA